MQNAHILDLYSGVGSFGIECISRGASKVVFIEENINTVKILKNNLIKLSIIDKAEIYNNKIENILKKNFSKKFNILFLDPPFKTKDFIENLRYIKKGKLYEDNHIVIIHRERKTFDNLDQCIKTLSIKNYGRSKIIFGKIN